MPPLEWHGLASHLPQTPDCTLFGTHFRSLSLPVIPRVAIRVLARAIALHEVNRLTYNEQLRRAIWRVAQTVVLLTTISI